EHALTPPVLEDCRVQRGVQSYDVLHRRRNGDRRGDVIDAMREEDCRGSGVHRRLNTGRSVDWRRNVIIGVREVRARFSAEVSHAYPGRNWTANCGWRTHNGRGGVEVATGSIEETGRRKHPVH